MPTMDKLKRQIQEEVSRVLMSFGDGSRDDKGVDSKKDWNEPEPISDDEMWDAPGSVDESHEIFDDEAALIWGDADQKARSIELIPDNMEDGHKYYFTYNGQRMFVEKKSVGKDKFEIGIFLDDSEV